MKVLTFYSLRFAAHHALEGHSESAAHDHWHAYEAKFFFTDAPDIDALATKMENFYVDIHGSDLTQEMEQPSTDENLAREFLKTWESQGCVRVEVTNDGRRGAVAES